MKEKRLKEIDKHFDGYNQKLDFDSNYIRFGFKLIKPHLNLEHTCELGCANGLMTEMLAGVVKSLDVVEGSQRYLEDVRDQMTGKGFRNIRYFHELWEDFNPDKKYSDILLTHGLDYVDDPVGLLKKMGKWLNGGGRIHIVVPNAQSFHMLLAVEMGLIRSVYELSEEHIRLGHKRKYDRESLFKDIEGAGLRVFFHTGFFLKTLPNSKLAVYDKAYIDALFSVSEKLSTILKDYCAELYVCCTK